MFLLSMGAGILVGYLYSQIYKISFKKTLLISDKNILVFLLLSQIRLWIILPTIVVITLILKLNTIIFGMGICCYLFTLLHESKV